MLAVPNPERRAQGADLPPGPEPPPSTRLTALRAMSAIGVFMRLRYIV